MQSKKPDSPVGKKSVEGNTRATTKTNFKLSNEFASNSGNITKHTSIKQPKISSNRQVTNSPTTILNAGVSITEDIETPYFRDNSLRTNISTGEKFRQLILGVHNLCNEGRYCSKALFVIYCGEEIKIAKESSNLQLVKLKELYKNLKIIEGATEYIINENGNLILSERMEDLKEICYETFMKSYKTKGKTVSTTDIASLSEIYLLYAYSQWVGNIDFDVSVPSDMIEIKNVFETTLKSVKRSQDIFQKVREICEQHLFNEEYQESLPLFDITPDKKIMKSQLTTRRKQRMIKRGLKTIVNQGVYCDRALFAIYSGIEVQTPKDELAPDFSKVFNHVRVLLHGSNYVINEGGNSEWAEDLEDLKANCLAKLKNFLSDDKEKEFVNECSLIYAYTQMVADIAFINFNNFDTIKKCFEKTRGNGELRKTLYKKAVQMIENVYFGVQPQNN